MNEDKREAFKQVAVFMTIPFVLAVPPIVGWFLGSWLDKQWGSAPFLMYLLLFLGFIAGVREVYRLIKRYGDGE